MENSFVDLMGRLRAGQKDAAADVVNRYAMRLAALARSRLSPKLRQKLDPEDVTQSVFRSFFRRHGREQFTLDDWRGLWGLLVTMTVRKCSRWAEFYGAQIRNKDKEMPLIANADGSTVNWELAAAEPTGEEAAILVETVEGVLRTLDERGRQVFELALQGSTVPEIADAIGHTTRLVYRKLEDIREHLEASQAEPQSPDAAEGQDDRS